MADEASKDKESVLLITEQLELRRVKDRRVTKTKTAYEKNS